MGILDRITGRIERFVDDMVVPDEVRGAVELAQALLGRGDVDAAVRELEHALELEPAYARAWHLLGLCYARRGERSRAIAALERAAAPGFPEALLALAEVHREAGDLAAAHATLRRALDGAPGPELLARLYRSLGEVHLAGGAYDKAVRELRKAAAGADEPEVHALLGQALLLQGDRGRARAALERAVGAATPPEEALRALGEIYLPDRPARAAEVFDRLLERDPGDAGALAGLARARLAQGDLPAALAWALRALAHAPASPAAHALVARVHARARSYEAALAALDHAFAAAPPETEVRVPDLGPLLPFALEVALAAEDFARADGYAARLLARAPDHAEALAARGLAALARGDETAALADLRRAIRVRDNVPARVGLGRHALARGDVVTAIAELRAALRLAPEHALARRLLGEAYRRQALPHRGGPEAPPLDLYVLLNRLHEHLLAHREVGDFAPEAARLVEVFDRPLLVTVMGEFSSGKSTFVNALLGEEVAPMGITPTTATINVLKYGAERMGRVLYRDDRTREVPWAEMPALLRGLDAEAARAIRLVEVLYPLEALARVNIVDTPGLNSIIPEHEEVAREFMAQADAIVWLFTAGQAGKQTEKEVLAELAREHKKTLGVVNKIDRVAAAEEAEILEHLRQSFGGYLEALTPLSAREALIARRTGDAPRLERARFAELTRLLEERFYSRGRALKRETCVARAQGLLARGRARAQAATVDLDAAAAALAAAAAAVAEAERRFEHDFLGRERQALARHADEGCAAAAREVLEFARPRRWPFGSNEAAPPDRDFLLDLLEERGEALIVQSQARVRAALGPILERVEEAARTLPAPAGGLEPVPGAAVPGREPEAFGRLSEEVYGRYRAFTRGYLRGGRVDDFFTRVLPRIELTEPALREALRRETVDLETELVAPLGAWAASCFAGLRARLRALEAEVALARFDVEERVFGPLEAFEAALGEAA